MNPTSYIHFPDRQAIISTLRTNEYVNPFFSTEAIRTIAESLANEERSIEELSHYVSQIDMTHILLENRERVIGYLMRALVNSGNSLS